MLGHLEDDQLETFVRAGQARLIAPATALKRRKDELGFLARLLDERPQPPDRLPYVERKAYTARRATESPDAPSAEWLYDRMALGSEPASQLGGYSRTDTDGLARTNRG